MDQPFCKTHLTLFVTRTVLSTCAENLGFAIMRIKFRQIGNYDLGLGVTHPAQGADYENEIPPPGLKRVSAAGRGQLGGLKTGKKASSYVD